MAVRVLSEQRRQTWTVSGLTVRLANGHLVLRSSYLYTQFLWWSDQLDGLYKDLGRSLDFDRRVSTCLRVALYSWLPRGAFAAKDSSSPLVGRCTLHS